MNKVTGLWLKANGAVEEVTVSSIDDIQRLVGGYFEGCDVEVLNPFSGQKDRLFGVYWDEEGKNKSGTRVNWGVTKLLQFFGTLEEDDLIVGDCLIVGSPEEPYGEDTSLVPEGVQFIKNCVKQVNDKVQAALDREFARIVSAEYGVKFKTGRKKRKKRKGKTDDSK